MFVNVKKNLRVVFFVIILSLNFSQTFLKFKNTTARRENFKLSRNVIPFVNSIRFKNENLTLDGNQEMFLTLPSASSFRLQTNAKLSKNALLYVFFHVKKETNRTGYAFRISAIPGVQTAFLKFKNTHVMFKKNAPEIEKFSASERWLTLAVESKNGLHTLFVDEKKVLSVRDKTFTDSKISFGSGLKPFTIDNLVIKSNAWSLTEDFSIKSAHRERNIIFFKIKWVLFFTIISFFIAALSQVFLNMSSEEKDKFQGHLRVQTFFLLPGAFLKTADSLCFPGTFIALALFFIHSARLFVRTNKIFLLPSPAPASFLPGSRPSAENVFRAAASLCGILFLSYFFLYQESRLNCTLKTCPKTLLLKKDSLSFLDEPYFPAKVRARNPAVSFDIYGKPNMALLVLFNENLPPVEVPEAPHAVEPSMNESYAMLLSFHKTLPTLLMRGQNIARAAEKNHLLINRWNHIEILTSGRNIVFFANGKKILSYPYRKLFHGGMRLLPVYELPQIKNFQVFSLQAEKNPALFNAADTLFFVLRLFLFFLLACYASYVFLRYASFSIPLSFFLKRAALLLFFPLLLWTLLEIHNHSAPGGNMLFEVFVSLGLLVSTLSFFLLHFFLCKRSSIQSLFLTFLFFEGLCLIVSPYTDTLRNNWFSYVHDKSHFWFFDSQVRLHNQYFLSNNARLQKIPYDKGSKTRLALFGSSSAYGQYFPEPSALIFSARLEKKLQRSGRQAEVLNFAIPGSTTFTGLLFFKGIYSLFKPDIVLWNYSGNDMFFMRGSLKEHNFLERVYTNKIYFLYRLLYKSATFHVAANIINSTWIKTLLYLPRPGAKQSLYENNLRALYSFCKKNRIPLVLVHETSDEAMWFRYDRKKQKFLDAKDKWFYDTLLAFSQKYRIPYVFTIPPMAERRDDRLYLDIVHYSKAGHDAMADILFEFLTKKKIIP